MTTDFDTGIGMVKDEYERLKKKNQKLSEENHDLKSEHYKDGELQKLSAENSELRTRCMNYGLRLEDYHECIQWFEDHKKKVHPVKDDVNRKLSKQAQYKFEIEEFAECTAYSIVCKECGMRHDIFY